jgi:hypothetical protein
MNSLDLFFLLLISSKINPQLQQNRIGYFLLPFSGVCEREKGPVCSHKNKIPAAKSQLVSYPHQFQSPLDKGHKSRQASRKDDPEPSSCSWMKSL